MWIGLILRSSSRSASPPRVQDGFGTERVTRKRRVIRNVRPIGRKYAQGARKDGPPQPLAGPIGGTARLWQRRLVGLLDIACRATSWAPTVCSYDKIDPDDQQGARMLLPAASFATRHTFAASQRLRVTMVSCVGGSANHTTSHSAFVDCKLVVVCCSADAYGMLSDGGVASNLPGERLATKPAVRKPEQTSNLPRPTRPTCS